MEGKLDRVRRAIGSSGLDMGIFSTGMAGDFGLTTLGGNAGGRSSWGRHIGNRIERGRVRVCESVARGGFACGGLLVVVHIWIS